jgi:hypothetical protein
LIDQNKFADLFSGGLEEMPEINHDEFQKNRKQYIMVRDRRFDFTQNDSIFRIRHSQVEIRLNDGSNKEGSKKEKI